MMNRYNRAPKIKAGNMFGTYNANYIIYQAVKRNAVDVITHVTSDRERLDILAGKYYGDGTLWWVIAAASGIGWGLQVPPDTYLIIPTDLSQISALVG